MSEKNILISIITPSFNRENEIDLLLQSLDKQTLDHSMFQVIISDDGSTDNTEQVVIHWQFSSSLID